MTSRWSEERLAVLDHEFRFWVRKGLACERVERLYRARRFLMRRVRRLP